MSRWPNRPYARILRTALKLASLIVPVERRDAWRSEWEAELWYLVRSDPPPSDTPRASPSWFVGGSFTHAARLRWRTLRFHGLGLDVRQAVRGLRASPAFLLGGGLSLALGIAIATAVVTVVDQVVFRPLPLDDANRIVRIWGVNTASGDDRLGVSWADFVDLRAGTRSLEALAAYRGWDANLHDGDGSPTLIEHGYVGEEFFDVFGGRVVLGRLFQPADHTPGAAGTVVLSADLWATRYGSDPTIVGRSIHVDSKPAMVIGVLASDFRVPDNARLWTPMPASPVTERDNQQATGFGRGWRNLAVAGRMRPGGDPSTVEEELHQVAQGLSVAYPMTNTAYALSSEPFLDALLGSWRRTLMMVLGIGVLVIVIVATNLANLLLGRSVSRSRESVLRRALGAGTLGAARVFMIETLMVTVWGCLAGLALGGVVLRVGLAMLPLEIPRVESVTVDLRIGIVMVVAAILVGTVAAIPAMVATTGQLAGQTLVRAGRALPARGAPAALVIGQLGISVALVVAAALLGTTLWNARQVSPGFEARETLSLRLSVRAETSPPWESFARFFTQLRGDLHTISGVEDVVLSLGRPIGPEDRFEVGVNIPGVIDNPVERRPTAHFRAVSPGYFALLGIPVDGRSFTHRDTRGAPGVAVVNRAFVDRFFPDRSPLGHTIERPTFWAPPYPQVAEIVGVVGNVRADGPSLAPAPAMYFPFAQNPFGNMYVLLRSGGPSPADLLPAVRERIWAIDPTLPVQSVEMLDQVLARQLAPARFGAAAAGLLAGFTVLLAAVGLFGVIRYRLERRGQEFGVRMVVGADASDLLGMVVREVLGLVAAGLLLGLPLALVTGATLESLLLGVSPFSLPVLLGTVVLLSCVALAAALVPAYRASNADPTALLRAG